jgi:type I restriction enzyme R subunit
MSNFLFLQPEFPELFEATRRVEAALRSDPRIACFYARFALESAVNWLFEHEPSLPARYENLGDNLHVRELQVLVPRPVWEKARLIQKIGNRAVHGSLPPSGSEALAVARELFHFSFWIARTYAVQKPVDSLAWEDSKVPPSPTQIVKSTRAQVQELKTKLEAAQDEIRNRPAPGAEELERLQAELALAKAAATQTPDAHDYSEKETRDLFIDTLLHEAGWPLNQKRDREFPVLGMPNNSGEGFVDYVLWGDDGLPLAVVEAKKSRKNASVGQQQAALYADCLEKKFGRRPIIFYTNGYETWLWDDRRYPPRAVQGFLTKDELERMIAARGASTLAGCAIDAAIVERGYQTRAIRKYLEALDGRRRKGLFVMATGTGKTRVAIALVDALLRAGWVKRVLFLADRTALVNQTVNAFKAHLPGSSPVALGASTSDLSGAVFVATYPAMMEQIEKIDSNGARKFGVGHFDLVIIDEAHRSVYQKYRAIFAYFDSLLLGLTATPRDEVDRDTYSLFDLPNGEPTDAYELSQAVADGFLTPPKLIRCDLRFPVEGIRYDELSDEEKAQWDLKDWGEDGAPDEVASHAVNSWLFNADTVDKVLATLMERGGRVAGGDRLGKTIVFARNHRHAEFIVERFDVNYPAMAGHFCRVIDNQVNYPQSLIDSFSLEEKLPQIAVSVDMLDTGIDVPDVLNLVLFKPVRSKTKFWQMIGRGTRLRPNLFGPGLDKKISRSSISAATSTSSTSNPRASRAARSRRCRSVCSSAASSFWTASRARADEETVALKNALADGLHGEVAAMNPANFVVRPQLRHVEKWAERASWNTLGPDAREEIIEHLAHLPSEAPGRWPLKRASSTT